MAEELKPYNLFTLTSLVGKKTIQERTVVIATVETRLRTAIWVLSSLVFSVVLAIFLGFWFMGPYAVLIPVLVTPAVSFAATTTSRKGLHLTHLQRAFDLVSRPKMRGMFVHCARLYDPFEVFTAQMVPASVAVQDLPDYVAPTRESPLGVEVDVDELGQEAPTVRTFYGSDQGSGVMQQAQRQARLRTAMMWQQREIERAEWAADYEKYLADVRQSLTGPTSADASATSAKTAQVDPAAPAAA